MEIIECEQGSEIWMQHRLGSIGGSSISGVTAGGQGKTRKSLLYRFAGEILSGQKYEGYKNHHMERGVEQEPDARLMYELMTDYEVRQVGLVKRTNHKHVSVDGLCGDDGIIEAKSVIPSVHVEPIIMDRVPPEHIKQIQWGLHICQREWCDFISYSPLVVDRPIWIKRVERDEVLINKLDAEADIFIDEMLEIVERVRDYDIRI